MESVKDFDCLWSIGVCIYRYAYMYVHVFMTYIMNQQITLVNDVEDLSNSVACLGCMLRGGSWSRDPQ